MESAAYAYLTFHRYPGFLLLWGSGTGSEAALAELPEERSLAGIHVLSVLPPEALREVERLCQFESYRPGSWLF